MSRPPLGSTLDFLGLSLPWYSILIMIAVVIGIFLAIREERRLKLPEDMILTFALLAIPLGIIGARLYYVAFSWGSFADKPLEILWVWHGGLAIYGAVLGGLLAAAIVTRKKKGTLPLLLDACAPALVLGQAIGRWGNYANMEAYGARLYEEATHFFPFAVEIRLLGANGTEYWYWHMATFFYESLWCFMAFTALMLFRKKMRRPGDVVCWYLLLYCAGRTVIEGLRDDSLLLNVSAAQVRISQILSAFVCLGVVVYFFIRLVKAHKPRFSDILSWVWVVVGIACTFVGEFERNAYQMLFYTAQLLLALLLLVDILFLILNFRKPKTPISMKALLCASICLCALTLAQGIGRLGEDNTILIAFRQLIAKIHAVMGGAWLYLSGTQKHHQAPRHARPEGV